MQPNINGTFYFSYLYTPNKIDNNQPTLNQPITFYQVTWIEQQTPFFIDIISNPQGFCHGGVWTDPFGTEEFGGEENEDIIQRWNICFVFFRDQAPKEKIWRNVTFKERSYNFLGVICGKPL